jgi:predicted O-linked N-acetylglucosamine transferase (SPINDLY family)
MKEGRSVMGVEGGQQGNGAPLSAAPAAGTDETWLARLQVARQALAHADFRLAASHLAAVAAALPAERLSPSIWLGYACALAATGELRASTDAVRRIAAPQRHVLVSDQRTDRALAEVLAVGWDAHQVQALLCAYAMRQGRWDYRASFAAALETVAGLRAGVPLHRSLVFDAFAYGQPDALIAALTQRFADDHAAHAWVPTPSAPGERKLRVALLSGEWRRHPTYFLHRDLLAALDRRRLHLTGIYLHDLVDHYTEDTRRLCDDWLHWPGLPPADVADAMRRQNFDVVWVLGSFQQTPVAEVLAHRPAPIAINGLASYYPHGPALVDYTVVDPITVPASVRPHWREALIELPDSAYVLGPGLQEQAPVPSRAQLGWPDDALVLAATHQPYKLSPECADLWAAVLHRCPSAVLWRIEGPAAAETQWRHAMHARGIGPERQRVTPHVGWLEHQARLQQADLFLDATPVGGHTTLLEALRVSLPAVSLAGPGPAGRIGHAMLHAVGLQEACCADAQTYIDKVTQWAHSPETRQRWRATLQAHHPGGAAPSPCFDPARHARWWEALLLHAWDRHRSGLPPQSFKVSD